jgi:hypothetical protein
MPICPNCQTPTDYLHSYGEVRRIAELEGKGKTQRLYRHKPQDTEAETFECPECSQQLFDNEVDAENFLKGKPCEFQFYA